MILGVGTDIVEVARVADAHARFGEAFLRRILLAEELAFCLSHRDSAPHIAARFAAKEAVSKAFGTGIGAELGWHDIEIVREASGKPAAVLRGAGEKLFRARSASRLHISLSHTRAHATAFAVLES